MRAEKMWAARILAIATASLGGACGGTTSTTGDAAADRMGDASEEAHDGATDAAADAAPDAVADGLADAPAPDVKPDVGHDVGAPDVMSVRRPFLVGSSMRAASAAARDDWSFDLPPAEGLDAAVRAELARVWLDDALQEHASIAAFARFSMLMLGVGAPSDLVSDAQRAALDEVRHARACFSLARRYGARESGPAALRVDDAIGPVTLAELAALTAEEGCVGETLGALLAKEQAAVARDPVVKPLLDRIARDEARHAELAWRFVAWAVARGGDEVLSAVETTTRRALAATLAMELRPLRVDPGSWAAHGRLSCASARSVAARGALEVVEPALDAMRRAFRGRRGHAPQEART